MLFGKNEMFFESYDDIMYDFNESMLESSNDFMELEKSLLETDIMLECLGLEGSLTDEIVTESIDTWINKAKESLKKVFDFVVEHIKKLGQYLKGLVFNNKTFVARNTKAIKENIEHIKFFKYSGFAYDPFAYKYIIGEHIPYFDIETIFKEVDKKLQVSATEESALSISTAIIVEFRKYMAENLLKTDSLKGLPREAGIKEFSDISFVNKVIECRFKTVDMTLNNITKAGDIVPKNEMYVISEDSVKEDLLKEKTKNMFKKQSERTEFIHIDRMLGDLEVLDSVCRTINLSGAKVNLMYKKTIMKLDRVAKKDGGDINTARVTSIVAKQWVNDISSIMNKTVSIHKACSNEYRNVCEHILKKTSYIVEKDAENDDTEYKNSIYKEEEKPKDNTHHWGDNAVDVDFTEA